MSLTTIDPLIILGIFVITAFFIGMPKTFAQCACAVPSDSAYKHFEFSDSVFVGKVLKIKNIKSDSEYKVYELTFRVETAWKTDLTETITVRNANSGDSSFKEHESYLVFAKFQRNVLTAYIGCCTETKLLSHAAKDLNELIDKGVKQTNIIRESPKDNGKPNKSMDGEHSTPTPLKSSGA